jgi:hypothetical protein
LVVWRSTLNVRGQNDQKLAKFENFIYFDLQWLKLTFKQQNFDIFGISDQFAIRKSTILIYRATSIFDLHMRIFNLQGLGALDKHKKKLSTQKLI